MADGQAKGIGMKPSDIDTSRQFLSSKWQKAELESIARDIVMLSQRKGEWHWFSSRDLGYKKYDGSGYNDLEWLGDMADCGFLVRNQELFYPTGKFFDYIEPYVQEIT